MFLHFYFTCLYLTYSIFFSFMNIRIIAVVSILMSFLANYVMYIFNCAFTNWLFHPYEYFLASLDIWNFFLFKIIYLNLRITTLQYTDGTRTSLKVTEDQDSRTGHKSHSWLKRARSVKEEETIFHWCMWKTQQISSRFVCSDWACFCRLIFPSFWIFSCFFGHLEKIFFFLNVYILVRG